MDSSLPPPLPPGDEIQIPQSVMDWAKTKIEEPNNTYFNDMSAVNVTGERYITDYYAGSQVAIYLGDLWLSDVTMIQYNAVQNKRPFYGYKSKKFDVVAQGTQLIEGVFSINYTHTNFMNMAVAKWQERSSATDVKSASNKLVADVQQTLNSMANETDPNLLYQLSYGPSGVMYNQDNSFADLNGDSKQAVLESYFWGVKDNALPADQVLQADDLPPFDVTVTFGNYPADRLNPKNTDEFISSHTVKVLTGIHITGSSMQVGPTGEPIQEVFTFIARAMDSPLTRVPKTALKS